MSGATARLALHVPADDGSPEFQLGDALPDGVTLLEASAGTGKTHTIASLAVRYLAEGARIDQLLVVTFTRSATGELRSRVRDRLVAAEAGVAAAQAGAVAPDDELVTLLSTGTPEEVERRRAAMAAAVADFDAATITTIHGFCEQVLAGLGTAADCGRDLQFVEDLQDLTAEVVDDFYLRKFRNADEPAFPRREAWDVVWKAVANRDAQLLPEAGGRDGAALRASLAHNARREVVARARRAGLVAYDDQLDRLCRTLDGPLGDAAVCRLRDAYRVVLVDEFQDTDPLQWAIFRAAFARSGAPLLLIGDPKQAIYSFRGADVWTYLQAAGEAGHRATLRTNWRGDQPLLDALDALMGGVTLGHPDIPFRQVRAAPGHEGSGLTGAPSTAPLRLRLVHRGDGWVETTRTGWASAPRARELIAEDLAADIAGLLRSPATVRAGAGTAPVSPGDIAVLVRTNAEAVTVSRALAVAGVPAVIAGGGSVYREEAAAAWLTLLEALEQPSNQARARAAALTPFVGWDVARLDSAADDDVDELQARIHRWAALLATAGVAALYEAVAGEAGLVAAQLEQEGGERRLTDLGHVAELLHAEALASGAGVRALTADLREHIARAGTDVAIDERSRRLDSDAQALQIQTIHRSKGLEWPIVYLPFLWGAMNDDDPMPTYHLDGGGRAVYVGGKAGDAYDDAHAAALEERRGEDLRQAYVALTRARHQVVAWWATAQATRHSPLARLVLAPPGQRDLADRPAKIPADDDRVEDHLREVADRARGSIAVERVGPPTAARFDPGRPDAAALDVARFARELDTAWRRASYTAITEPAHGRVPPAVGSEVERGGLTDEPAVPPPGDPVAPVPGARAAAGTAGLDAVPPMADLPAGAAFGILVHAVLEGVDFAAADLPAAMRSRIDEVLGRRSLRGDDVDRGRLAAGLAAVVTSPLGALAGGGRLADLGPRDRLDELGFELPLVGGDRPHGHVGVVDVADALRRWLPADDPLAGYPERLSDPALDRDLRGFLTGSLDLVARFQGADGPRHLVVDYKTNRLRPSGEVLRMGDYRPERLTAAMIDEHYPLQAVLYSVALHRYLRWRQPGYRPELHLGGVLYLFVRGMAGPSTPIVDSGPCGVFAWAPPAGLVVELSDRFDEGVG
jgi:exodeoxyribonuclease V beta subunit